MRQKSKRLRRGSTGTGRRARCCDHIHGLSPFPGAWCEMALEGEQVRVKVLRCELTTGSGAPGDVLDDRLTVACGDGAIRILELQRAGKAPMKADVFLRGTPLEAADAAKLMPRYKLIIEYDGGPFCGWQLQDNGASVQGALEVAVKAICGEQVRVHGAGRTDAGVHALGQVAHFDIAKHFVPGRFRDGLNAHLRPHPIGVLSAEIVEDSFEARFSAKKRHYLYRISIAAPISRSTSARPGGCRAGSIAMRCTPPRSD